MPLERGGFIVLHRKILDSDLWTLPDAQLRVALRLLLEANWKPSYIRWGGSERILQRGQIIFAERRFAKRDGVARKTVRNTIDALCRQQSITVEKGPHGSILTWLNYSRYQDVDATEGPTEGTTQGTTQGTNHNKGTSKQVNKKAKEPSVATIAATAIGWARKYLAPRVIDNIDAMAIRRRVKAGMPPEVAVARAYVGIHRAGAVNPAQALSLSFDTRMEAYASHIEHHSAEVSRRLGARDSSPPVAGAPGQVESVEARLQATGFDLGACERAVSALGGEAGLLQDNAQLDDWMQSRLARQAGSVGQHGTVDGADVRDVREQDGADTSPDARAARHGADAGAGNESSRGNGSVQEASDSLSLPGI